MSERRTGMDRRSGRDRRNGGTSSYNGPARRSLRYRSSDTDRRKNESQTQSNLVTESYGS